jgi:acyl carrier protein
MSDQSIRSAILLLLDEALDLSGRAASFVDETRLLGMPGLDSFGVVQLITRLQQRFAITIHDDEIDGAVFATVGSLVHFVSVKTAGAQT